MLTTYYHNALIYKHQFWCCDRGLSTKLKGSEPIECDGYFLVDSTPHGPVPSLAGLYWLSEDEPIGITITGRVFLFKNGETICLGSPITSVCTMVDCNDNNAVVMMLADKRTIILQRKSFGLLIHDITEYVGRARFIMIDTNLIHGSRFPSRCLIINEDSKVVGITNCSEDDAPFEMIGKAQLSFSCDDIKFARDGMIVTKSNEIHRAYEDDYGFCVQYMRIVDNTIDCVAVGDTMIVLTEDRNLRKIGRYYDRLIELECSLSIEKLVTHPYDLIWHNKLHVTDSDGYLHEIHNGGLLRWTFPVS